MRTLRIQNLRSLADTGDIEIKPITLLLGQNSSGKSTFLRFFPLLRQSSEARTTGPLLWYGRFVDFGSFQDSLYREAKEPEISFAFKVRLDAEELRFSLTRPLSVENLLEISLKVCLREDPQSRATTASRVNLSFEDQFLDLAFSNEGTITRMIINGEDLSTSAANLHVGHSQGVIPTLIEFDEDEEEGAKSNTTRGRLLRLLGERVHHKTSVKRLEQLADQLVIGSSASLLKRMKEISIGGSAWERHAKAWTPESPAFRSIRNALLAASAERLLDLINPTIGRLATNIRYIAPVRATAERYYRFQDLAVDEVDFQGKNLAMYLQTLRRDDFENFANWTDENFGFRPSIATRGDHISISLREHGSGYEFNLADTGFGFSQVLPVLTQLWVMGTRTSQPRRGLRSKRQIVPAIYAVEQPELHLHPRLQARLADMLLAITKLARAQGIDLRLVVETHSESIVNRLGNHAASDAELRQLVSIVLFERDNPKQPTRVRVADFDERGFLKNWPFGFFEPDPIMSPNADHPS